MFLFFAVYSLIAVLSIVMPENLPFLLGLNVLFTCIVYIRHVYIPMFYSGFSMWFGPGVFFLPVLLMITAAVLVPDKKAVLWFYYGVTVFVGIVVPVIRYLHSRISLYRLIGKYSEYSLFRWLCGGEKTPLRVTLDTDEGKVTVAVLGNIGASRYIVDGNSVSVQRIRALAADILPKMEKKEDSDFVCSLLLPLVGRKRTVSFACAEGCDEAYLFVHPGSVIYNAEKPAEIGERVGGYNIASLKYIQNTVRRMTRIKE